jgi:hypothetical protein
MADSKLPPRNVAHDLIDKLRAAEGNDFLDPEVRIALFNIISPAALHCAVLDAHM